MRIGFGYDVHAFCEGRKLILGGIEINHNLGLMGHSDADVLTHAICDSILGSLSLSDIGFLFPDSDSEYSGISSIKLLDRVYSLMTSKGYKIGNIDTVIVCQAPKIAPYIEEMRKNIAKALNTDIENISIKATTEEGLGFTGQMEGIKAYSSCLIKKISG